VIIVIEVKLANVDASDRAKHVGYQKRIDAHTAHFRKPLWPATHGEHNDDHGKVR
jgi:hypothetical protein